MCHLRGLEFPLNSAMLGESLLKVIALYGVFTYNVSFSERWKKMASGKNPYKQFLHSSRVHTWTESRIIRAYMSFDAFYVFEN